MGNEESQPQQVHQQPLLNEQQKPSANVSNEKQIKHVQPTSNQTDEKTDTSQQPKKQKVAPQKTEQITQNIQKEITPQTKPVQPKQQSEQTEEKEQKQQKEEKQEKQQTEQTEPKEPKEEKKQKETTTQSTESNITPNASATSTEIKENKQEITEPNDSNPYIDDDLKKAQKQFSPQENKEFEQKHDINKSARKLKPTQKKPAQNDQVNEPMDEIKSNKIDKNDREYFVSNYKPESPPQDVKQKIEEYFHTSYPIHITEDVFNTEPDLVRLRRYFHAHPELSWQEIETGKNILKYCESLGLVTKKNVGKTGIVAVLHGQHSDGPCIALRADMDALPIQEENNNIPYKSRIKNVSHACGHDCHMAILLTVARILSQPKYVKQLHGCIKFIFQPAEEGGAGAKYMISDGVLEEDYKELNCPSVDQIYGLHVWSYSKLGKIILRSGALMAGSSKFNMKIKGIGGHGAEPKNTADTVLATTQLAIQLHSIISRNLSPLDCGVLTIGTMNVGNNSNIIAENGSITGTVRFLDDEIFNLIKKRMHQICEGIETSYNVEIKVVWGKNPYPPVINRNKNVEYVRNAVNKIFPINENCVIENHTTMAAEDFSFYLNEKPGCFFFVGCGVDENENENENDLKEKNNKLISNNAAIESNTDGIKPKIYAHHTSKFRVDERCLIVGVQIFVNLIMDLLSNPSQSDDVNKNENDVIVEDKIIGFTNNDKK